MTLAELMLPSQNRKEKMLFVEKCYFVVVG